MIIIKRMHREQLSLYSLYSIEYSVLEISHTRHELCMHFKLRKPTPGRMRSSCKERKIERREPEQELKK